MTKNFYKATAGIMLVFGVDDKSSFDNVKFWIKKAEESAPEYAKFILVGNKIDSEKREVSFKEGKDLADRMGV